MKWFASILSRISLRLRAAVNCTISTGTTGIQNERRSSSASESSFYVDSRDSQFVPHCPPPPPTTLPRAISEPDVLDRLSELEQQVHTLSLQLARISQHLGLSSYVASGSDSGRGTVSRSNSSDINPLNTLAVKLDNLFELLSLQLSSSREAPEHRIHSLESAIINLNSRVSHTLAQATNTRTEPPKSPPGPAPRRCYFHQRFGEHAKQCRSPCPLAPGTRLSPHE